MSSSEGTKRGKSRLGILTGSVLLGVLIVWLFGVTGLGTWLTDVSDALWWELLPWGLLGLFWLSLGVALYRKHRKRYQG